MKIADHYGAFAVALIRAGWAAAFGKLADFIGATARG